MTDKVSIVMPAFNSADFISSAIESAIRQTYDEWELIVVDDGSSDGTREIVLEFARRESRVTYVAQRHGGVSKARNEGLSRASGSVVAFLDSDDLWEAGKLDVQIGALQQSGVDMVFSDAFVFTDDKSAPAPRAVLGRLSGPEMLRALLLGAWIPTPSCVVICRNTLEALGQFDETLLESEDYDLYLRLAAGGATFLGLPDRLVHYRKHARSLSADPIRMLKAEGRVLRRYLTGRSLDSTLRRRVCNKYYYLVSVLASEGRFAEAGLYLRDVSHYDAWRISVWIRRLILAVAPSRFNSLSEDLAAAGDVLRRGIVGRRPASGD